MQTISKSLFHFPSKLPNKKILSVDIGGTLAKTAFYIPRDDSNHKVIEHHELLSKNSVPCK
jgi:hypothetical protein